ncbi:AMED_5909 family protein [Actinosynnema sp. NPDC050436]|uniref:AMED_5909 family protein n=1 Tax=Actinosynnema sp. NPDC050436 TaxID=3155659 RepID=UPI0033E0D542
MNKAKSRKSELWAAAMAAGTLGEAHAEVGKLVPAPDAAPSEWKAFYEQSVKVYERIAEVDRAHHHETQYWITRERRKGEAIELPNRRTSSDGRGRGGGGDREAEDHRA